MKTVNLLRVELSVERGLRGLPYPSYLAAMWIINSELAEQYRDRNTPEGVDLVERSLALLREAVEESSADRAGAGVLKLKWFTLTGVSQDEDFDDEASEVELPVDPGAGNFWLVVISLMAELEKETHLYFAINTLTLAITMIKDEEAEAAEYIEVTRRRVEESSFSVQMLRKCLKVLDLVRQAEDGDILDLDQIRAAAFSPKAT